MQLLVLFIFLESNHYFPVPSFIPHVTPPERATPTRRRSLPPSDHAVLLCRDISAPGRPCCENSGKPMVGMNLKSASDRQAAEPSTRWMRPCSGALAGDRGRQAGLGTRRWQAMEDHRSSLGNRPQHGMAALDICPRHHCGKT
jgi:hypothetical protein